MPTSGGDLSDLKAPSTPANIPGNSPLAPSTDDRIAWETEKSAYYKGADPVEYLEKYHPEMLATILKVGATTAAPTTKETLRGKR